MVPIQDGNSEIGAYVSSEIGFFDLFKAFVQINWRIHCKNKKCRSGRFDAQEKEDEAAGMLREVASNHEVRSLIIGHQSIQQVDILDDCISQSFSI